MKLALELLNALAGLGAVVAVVLMALTRRNLANLPAALRFLQAGIASLAPPGTIPPPPPAKRRGRIGRDRIDTPPPIPIAMCRMPPVGWTCTRSAGHDGPCAAILSPPADDEK